MLYVELFKMTARSHTRNLFSHHRFTDSFQKIRNQISAETPSRVSTAPENLNGLSEMIGLKGLRERTGPELSRMIAREKPQLFSSIKFFFCDMEEKFTKKSNHVNKLVLFVASHDYTRNLQLFNIFPHPARSCRDDVLKEALNGNKKILISI
jgi:hypothetical protein